MAAGNQVVITFAGEEKPLTESFNRVGAAAKDMDSKVSESASGFERVGGSADNAERNIIGVHDVIDGTATIMQGPGKQGIVAYLQGWADLAGGIAPMAEYLAQTRVATLASAAAQKVVTAAQWAWNAAQLASPTTWIIVGILALVAVIVLIATKTDWFSKAWNAAWGWIKNAAAAAWDWIKNAALGVWNWLQGIPGRLKSAFSTVADIITAPYRIAFNAIARLWNNTIGQLSWTVPSWVPVFGGNTISVPHLPTFHAGGTVPGFPGEQVPIMAQAGEVVSTPGAGGRGDTVYVRGDGLVDALIEAIAGEVRRRGGDPGTLGLGGSGA